MFQSSMPLSEAVRMGRERAIEELKFTVVQQIRAAGEDEMNFFRQIEEIEDALYVTAVRKTTPNGR